MRERRGLITEIWTKTDVVEAMMLVERSDFYARAFGKFTVD